MKPNKHLCLSFLLPVVILPFAAFDKGSLLNAPMPLLPAKTLDGQVIDENYYRGHVTIVSFMYIGCAPCMREITVLNRIKEDYRTNGKLQVLCVARQLREQMIEFNGNNETLQSKIRRALGADSIEYAIQPACSGTLSKTEAFNQAGKPQGAISIKTECTTLEEKYGLSSYPVIFYVDKNGIVRSIHKGGPAIKNDSAFYNNIKAQIDQFLME